MKKSIIVFCSVLLCSISTAFSQGEVEALKLSGSDLSGTARGIAMGGAFGALGGDLTGVSINPAGIGVYRSSEVVGTLGLAQEKSEVASVTRNKTQFAFDNIGFVGYFPLRSNAIPFLNFGFTYNNIKNFDKNITTPLGTPNSSLMDYMCYVSNTFNEGKGVNPSLLDFNITDDPFSSGAPWLSVLGFNGYLINPNQTQQGYEYTPLHNEAVDNSISLSERGYVNSYDFTLGTMIDNKLNIGVALTVADLYYRLTSRYSEEFSNGVNAGFDLRNYLKTDGAGVGAKVGIIYRPINSFRIGISYHSPVWYYLTDTYSAEIEHNVTNYVSDSGYKPGIKPSDVYSFDYRLQTPDKWVFSLAGVLGNNFIASLDYEINNYGSMKLKGNSNDADPDAVYAKDNKIISEDYKSSSTVRIGIEYRFTPQFSGRLGYSWVQNPYVTEYYDGGRETAISGSTTIYRIEGDKNYFTGGLGYRFSPNVYLDLALVYKTQKDKLYPYPSVPKINLDASPFSLSNKNIKGLLTFGYKF
ncbi:OmpP1/FadL family transporter [Seramator thermalis]|uniref:OmpP1/FadL family transporter n=1 Tax=Seramator thermalis TaxID=2496270 RepID=UPI00101BB1A5|nr:outer membrane protein transport protein [Seramator thermalis]